MAATSPPPPRRPRATVLPPQTPAEKATQDAETNALYMELADAERAARAEEMWKRFGALAVLVSLLVVLGTAGVTYWQRHQETARVSATAKFFTGDVLVREGKLAEAAANYGYTAKKNKELRPLLLLRQAELLSGDGQTAQALAVLRQLLAIRDIDPALRDTARLSLARQTADPKEMRENLAAAAAPGAPFAPLAQQMRAALAMAENNPTEAQADLKAIDTASPSLPPKLKQRTEEMRSAFILNQAATVGETPSAAPEKALFPAEETRP